MAGWEQEFAKWIAQPEQQKYIRGQIKAGRKSGGGKSSYGYGDLDEAKKKLDEIIARLKAVIEARIPSMKRINANLFVVPSQPEVDSEGNYVFKVKFNPRAVMRDSLCCDDGLDNVVQYLTTGARPTSHWVAGYWISPSSVAATSPYYYIPEGYTRNPDPFYLDEIEKIKKELAVDYADIIVPPEYGGAGASRRRAATRL